MRTDVRTDPAVIRRALDLADASSLYAASKQLGIPDRTIGRWAKRRESEHPGWPTDADIAAWRADQAANGEERRRKAARVYRYEQMVYLNGGPLMKPSLGVARRLRALAALGYPQAELAAELGVSKARVGHLQNRYYDRVFPATFDAVDDLFERLCMLPPPEGFVHDMTRRHARERGWAPPLAWDDIDDPTERAKFGTKRRPKDVIDFAVVQRVIDGEVLDTTKAEKDEIMRRWLALGRSERALCKRMGWHDSRYGRQETAA